MAAGSAAATLGLAGCSGSTSGSNSSNGNSGSGDSDSSGDSGSNESSGGEETTTSGSNESSGSSGGSASNESSSGSGETTTSGGSESSGSSSISDSGSTDVKLKSADVADAYKLESVAYYSEDFSSGVKGEVTNITDSTISYTGIEVKFFDSEGTRLGQTLDNATDLGAGKTYAFDAVSLLTSDKKKSVARYTITISDSPL